MLAILTTHPIQYQVPIWKALAARGKIPIHVLYMSDQGLRPRFDPGFQREIAWDLDLLSGYPHTFLDVHTGPRQDSFWWLRLKPGFSRLLAELNANTLWIQGWQVAAYWQAALACKGVGLGLWIRGDTNPRSNDGNGLRRLKLPLVRSLVRSADRLLYVGTANRTFYLAAGADPARLAPALHCVANSRFIEKACANREARNIIRQRWNIPTNAFCFLFAGKLNRQKRPEDLAEAARRLQASLPGREIHLLWVGTGELRDDLEKACSVVFNAGPATAGAAIGRGKPNASFVGFLNQTQIGQAYAAADCLVLPSNAQETWGLVVNEAMASGLPCIVSDACGCAEDLVRPFRPDLCFAMGEIEQLEAAMASAIVNPPAAAALQAYIEPYNYLHTVESVEALYRTPRHRIRAAA